MRLSKGWLSFLLLLMYLIFILVFFIGGLAHSEHVHYFNSKVNAVNGINHNLIGYQQCVNSMSNVHDKKTLSKLFPFGCEDYVSKIQLNIALAGYYLKPELGPQGTAAMEAMDRQMGNVLRNEISPTTMTQIYQLLEPVYGQLNHERALLRIFDWVFLTHAREKEIKLPDSV